MRLFVGLLPQLEPKLHSIRFDRQFSYFSVDPHVYMDLKFPQNLSPGSQFSTLGSVLQDELLNFSEAFERGRSRRLESPVSCTLHYLNGNSRCRTLCRFKYPPEGITGCVELVQNFPQVWRKSNELMTGCKDQKVRIS